MFIDICIRQSLTYKIYVKLQIRLRQHKETQRNSIEIEQVAFYCDVKRSLMLDVNKSENKK